MRILGIDPGIGRTGWGIIDSEKHAVKVLDYGCIETGKDEGLGKRILTIYEFITDLFVKYAIDAMGIEDLFFNTNAKTALIVGQARGVVLLAAEQHNIKVGVYTPLQVKVAVTGYGRAEKNQIGVMVKTLLKLKSIPQPDDTADALAIALTHAFSKKFS